MYFISFSNEREAFFKNIGMYIEFFIITKTMRSVISNMLKSIISTTIALKNALAIAILRLLPKSATPLIMSLTIKPFGFVLLATGSSLVELGTIEK
jgi:hypothetical protein